MREAVIVEAEIQHLETQMARVDQGTLDPELFKKLRLQYGIYGLRGGATRHMVRVRVPLGIITPDQLDALAEICERWTPSASGHLTTRQDVQLYGIERGELPAVLRSLAAAGLTTREASGNVVRNVTCCPWAGISRQELFDVTLYAQALSDYLLRNPLSQLLPRKVKIAFEGCATDHARVAIHDLGFLAALHEGSPGFRIYVGGGLGASPRVGQLLEPWTAMGQVLPTVEAILRVFERFGERRVRARARLKFLVEQLGWEEFRRRVLELRSQVWATQSGRALVAWDMSPCVEEPPPTVPGDSVDSDTVLHGFAAWSATNVRPQWQPGLSSVLVRVALGDLGATQWRGLAALVRQAAGGCRLTPEQNVLLRFVPYDSLPWVYAALKRLGLAASNAGCAADVTRCPGADSCLLAITHPKGLAAALEGLFQDGLSRCADLPLAIKVSGCPNSCGHHPIADIGLHGAATKLGDRAIPCYQILVGGLADGPKTRFGQRLARVPARRAPEAIQRLILRYCEARRTDESFADFVDRVGLASLAETLEGLAQVHAESAPDDLFMDLGATEPFLLQAGKGECAE